MTSFNTLRFFGTVSLEAKICRFPVWYDSLGHLIAKHCALVGQNVSAEKNPLLYLSSSASLSLSFSHFFSTSAILNSSLLHVAMYSFLIFVSPVSAPCLPSSYIPACLVLILLPPLLNSVLPGCVCFPFSLSTSICSLPSYLQSLISVSICLSPFFPQSLPVCLPPCLPVCFLPSSILSIPILSPPFFLPF